MTRSDFYREVAKDITLNYMAFKTVPDDSYLKKRYLNNRNNTVDSILDRAIQKVKCADLLKDLRVKGSKNHKYLVTDFISPDAYEILKSGNIESGSLTYEHLVCCNLFRQYFAFISNKLDSPDEIANEIYGVLYNNYFVATITKEEDRLLPKYMPKDWTWGDDPFVRYKSSGLMDKMIFTNLFEN